ncbi:SsgA family sporulation/cell division regulator [Streptomyces sp. MS06]|uniref:SsgA family sporulation/cell division regulator n=1 Tax=Streptomyces sp. MS06 TaxID=3385974 RepID=UPI0039A1159A
MHDSTDTPRSAQTGHRAPRTHLTLTVVLFVSGAEALPLRARFAYDTADPLAIRMGFLDAPDEVRPWAFSRDLLYTGLRTRAGEHAVQVWPPCRCHSTTMVRIVLRGGGAAAVLYVPAAELKSWLEETFALVPVGEEGAHLRLDESLEELLRQR